MIIEMNNYKKMLLTKQYKIAAWGIGYIGFSNLCFFGKSGVKGVGIDISESVVNAMMKEKNYLNDIDYWLGFDYKYLIDNGLIKATTNWESLIDENILVHFISVPTEKNDEPYTDAVFQVIENIAYLVEKSNVDGTLIIIESTLVPGTAEKIMKLFEAKIKKKFYFGVSPRRDWFMSGDKNLTELARIYGGNSAEANEKINEVLSIVCNNLVEASDYRHAEAVKCIENAFRHVDITFANQLALGFPDLNIREVLKLAGTKWNMNTYYPSFGTGGYCIPLSSKYILGGTSHPEKLTLLHDTIDFDENHPKNICRMIMDWDVKNIAILGISYKEDTKVYKSSPALKMINYFKENNIEVWANDPYYSCEEIENQFNAKWFDFNNMQVYNQFDAIVVVAAHRAYNIIDKEQLLNNLSGCKIVYDNTGLWDNFEELDKLGIKYKLVGSKGWTNK